MKIKLYHGTKRGVFEDIILNGFSNENPIWKVSSKYCYFFLLLNKTEYQGIENAIRSSFISAAVEFSNDTYTELIEISLDEDLFLKYFTFDDSSGKNDFRAVKIKTKDLNMLFKQRKVEIFAYKIKGYKRELAPFIISLIESKESISSIDESLMHLYDCILLEKIGSYADLLKSELFIYSAAGYFNTLSKKNTIDLYKDVKGNTFARYINTMVEHASEEILMPDEKYIHQYEEVVKKLNK